MNYILIDIYYIKFVIMDEIVSSDEIKHTICLFWCNNGSGHSCHQFNCINIQKLDDNTVMFDITHIKYLTALVTLIYNIKTKSDFSLTICDKHNFNIKYARYKSLTEFEDMLYYNFNNITYDKYFICIGDQISVSPGSYKDDNSFSYYDTNNPGLTLTCKNICEFINLPILQKYRINHSKTICTYD